MDDEEIELRLPERPRALDQLPGWFVVKYDDECRRCRASIYVKEWARMTDDGILCSGCAAEEE